MKDSQQVKDMTEELMNAPMDSKLAEMTRVHDEVKQEYSKMLEAIKLKEQEEEEREAKAEQAARDLLATKEARHKAEDRLRAEECERRECEALERTIAETEELRENRSEDPRSVEELEKAIKRIIDRRKSIEADTQPEYYAIQR